MRALRRLPGQRLRQGEKPRQPVHLRKARRGQRLAARDARSRAPCAPPACSCRRRRAQAAARRRATASPRSIGGRPALRAVICKQPGECAHAALHRARAPARATDRAAYPALRCTAASSSASSPSPSAALTGTTGMPSACASPAVSTASAAGTQRIHHVQCQHDRHAQLQQLQRQVQAARRARRVRDADDRVRRAAEQIRCA